MSSRVVGPQPFPSRGFPDASALESGMATERRNRGRAWNGLLLVLLVCIVAGAALLRLASMLYAPRMRVPTADGLLLSDVTVVNPGSGRLVHHSILVQGNRIAEVSGSRSSSGAPQFRGRFVLPGLVDMHVHLPPRFLPGEVELFNLLFLRHGVTAIRETASLDGSSFEARRRVVDGDIVGPRIFTCGRGLDGSRTAMRPRVVRTRSEGREAVRVLVGEGADCVKVFSGIGIHALAGAKEEAVRQGVPVVGHVPERVRFADAGLDEVQHLTGVPPAHGRLSRSQEFVPDARIDTVTRISRGAGIAHTPTLVAFLRMAALADYPGLGATRGSELPSYYAGVLWDPARFPVVRDMTSDDLEGLATRLRWMRRAVERLHDAGVPVFLGTDTPNPFVIPGASAREELRLLVSAGLTLEEAWFAGTRGPGEYLGLELLGSIEAGAPADLAIYREDPTRDLAALESLEAVVADGRLYLREDLDRALVEVRSGRTRGLVDAIISAVAKVLLPARDV